MSTQDQKVLDLIKKVKDQRALIQKTERSKWRTTCQFGTTNIHTADRNKVMDIAATLCGEKRNIEEASRLLGTKCDPVFFGGFSFEDCIEDLKTRLAKIALAEEKKKLASLEARLNGIMSPELKARLELEDIEKELME